MGSPVVVLCLSGEVRGGTSEMCGDTSRYYACEALEVRERFWSPMCRAEVAGVHQRMCGAAGLWTCGEKWRDTDMDTEARSSSMHPEIPIPHAPPINDCVILRTSPILPAESTLSL